MSLAFPVSGMRNVDKVLTGALGGVAAANAVVNTTWFGRLKPDMVNGIATDQLNKVQSLGGIDATVLSTKLRWSMLTLAASIKQLRALSPDGTQAATGGLQSGDSSNGPLTPSFMGFAPNHVYKPLIDDDQVDYLEDHDVSAWALDPGQGRRAAPPTRTSAPAPTAARSGSAPRSRAR
ncbi:MAG: hypothetical protein U0359_05500 [Byssovorax sp.]